MQKIMLIDIGNTTIVCGIVSSESDINSEIKSYRFITDIHATIDELGQNIIFCLNQSKSKKEEIKSVIISSVVPQLDNKIEEAISKYVGVKSSFVDPSKDLGMPITYASPEEIGADRIVNSIAGVKLYGAPLIIVDIGTAVTIDVISKNAEYVGGVIFQGIQMTLDALCNKTAKLPKIEMKEPKKIIGRSTNECMQSGVYYSFLGGMAYIVKKIKEEYKMDGAKVVLSGGYTELFKKETQLFDIFDKDLTLKGLALIYEKVKSER